MTGTKANAPLRSIGSLSGQTETTAVLELWRINHFYAVIESCWQLSHRRFEQLKCSDCWFEWFVCSTTNPLNAHMVAFKRVWSCKHPQQPRQRISWEHQAFQTFRVSSCCPESLWLTESVLEEEEEPDQPMPDPALDWTDETFLVPKSLHQMGEKHRKSNILQYESYDDVRIGIFTRLALSALPVLHSLHRKLSINALPDPRAISLLWNDPLRRNLQWSSWTRKKSRWPSAQRSLVKGSPRWMTVNSVETV